jgi:O-antigen ligase
MVEMADGRRASNANAAVGLAFAITCIGTLIDDMTFGALITPFVYVLVVYAMNRVPLRDSMLFLIFLALVLIDPADGSPVGDFSPPFAGAGAALLAHLNAVARPLGISWAAFSVMDLFLVSLLWIALMRHSRKSRIDGPERIATPRPMVQLAYLSFAGTTWTWMVGLLSGGDFGKSLWQLNRVMYLPLIFLLSHMAFRGPQDLTALLRVLLGAAAYKALLALWVVFTSDLPPDPYTGSTRPIWAISHQDSILFATGFVAVFALVLERVGGARRALRPALVLLPLFAAGMWANNRRTAWVQVATVFITMFLLAKSNPVKRKIQRALYVLVPVASIYVMIGWNGGGPMFKPVHLMRSVVDAQSDGSSNWRELENFDIRETFKANPIFGTGYGHGYLEFIKLPEVGYDLELYCPHNSLLGIWAYAGVVGYTTLTLLWVAGVYFAVRAYHASRDPNIRAAALTIIGAVVVYVVQCWGDLGLGTWIGVFLVGPGLAIAGKLSVATGQWDQPRIARGAPAGAFAEQPFKVG